MASYSVADAKAGLPGLINRVLAGEDVVITRHGKPVAELRPVTTTPKPASAGAALERLLSRRAALPPGAPTSVELLNLMYDESND